MSDDNPSEKTHISYNRPKKSKRFQPFELATAHLSQNHINFFQKWSKMILLEIETRKQKHTISDIWRIVPSERERNGHCFHNMKVFRFLNRI